jgi:hypothetical protein
VLLESAGFRVDLAASRRELRHRQPIVLRSFGPSYDETELRPPGRFFRSFLLPGVHVLRSGVWSGVTELRGTSCADTETGALLSSDRAGAAEGPAAVRERVADLFSCAAAARATAQRLRAESRELRAIRSGLRRHGVESSSARAAID